MILLLKIHQPTAASTGASQDLGRSHTKLRHEPRLISAVLKPCLLVSLMLPEQGGATEQEQTATSSLRASPFPKKPGTAQISARLGASFAPHGMLCSGISEEKQKEKAAKCSRDLDGFCHAKRMAPPWSTHIRHPLLTNPALPTPGQPSRSAGGIPLSWKHLPDFSRHPASLS